MNRLITLVGDVAVAACEWLAFRRSRRAPVVERRPPEPQAMTIDIRATPEALARRARDLGDYNQHNG